MNVSIMTAEDLLKYTKPETELEKALYEALNNLSIEQAQIEFSHINEVALLNDKIESLEERLEQHEKEKDSLETVEAD